MKWIVLYTIIKSTLIPCPPTEVVCDEYGVCPQSYATTSQACFETTRQQKSVEFATLEAATEFMEKGKEKYGEQLYGTDSGITDWEIRRLE